MPASEYKVWKEKCDLLWSKLIRIMYPYCYFPGCNAKTQEACHTIKRKYLGTRWDSENGLGGCRWHNQWEETNKEEAEKIKKSIIGINLYRALESRAEAGEEWKLTRQDLEFIASGLEEKLRSSGLVNVRVRSIREAQRKREKKRRECALGRFKQQNGGKTPYQVAYARKKEYLKSLIPPKK